MEQLPVADLATKAAPYNPRKISDRDLEALRRSLRYFGAVEPVVVNTRLDRIVGGHQRIRAAQAEGIADFPVVYVDLDEPSEKQLNLALNRISGQWDDEKLREVLVGLEAEGADLGLTGFDSTELDRLLRPALTDNPDQDNLPEQVEQRCNTGDLWTLGKHRLLCGDSTSATDLAKLLDGETPNLCVTDPPYGVEYDPDWRNVAAEAGQLDWGPRRTGKVMNDDRADWSDTWKLIPCDVLYTWTAPGPLFIQAGYELMAAGFEIRNQIVWSKNHFPIGRGAYTYRHEACWYAVRKGRKADWIGEKNECTVWEATLDKNIAGGHSTQKPVALMEHAIRNHRGDVLEPFAGTGTTVIAAENQGRRCFAMELSPEYCDVILARWEANGGTVECVTS